MGGQLLHKYVCQLGGHALLQLRPTGGNLHRPGQFAGANDPVVFRNIYHRGSADEWQEMVFAHRVKLDILHGNHLVVVSVEEGGDHISWITVYVPKEVIDKHRADTPWGITQPLLS